MQHEGSFHLADIRHIQDDEAPEALTKSYLGIWLAH